MAKKAEPVREEPKMKKWPWMVGGVVALALLSACDEGLDSNNAASETATTETSVEAEETTAPEGDATEETATAEEPAVEDDGIDWYMVPQDWATEYLRETCNPGESIAHRGKIICDVEGVDVSGDNDVLEFYFSSDDAVKNHFNDMPERRQMMADSLATIVALQKDDGEPRLDRIQSVRVIGPGGWTGAWDATADVT